MILLLLLLVSAIALGLAGLFELPVLAGGRPAGPRRRACAAPSSPARSPPSSRRPAPARSWAPRWARPWCCRRAGALAIFAGLGLGLALPFLLLGFVPALRRLLPKPGGWMDDVPAHPLAADVPDRARARLGARPGDRRRRHDDRRSAARCCSALGALVARTAAAAGRRSSSSRWPWRRRCSSSRPRRQQRARRRKARCPPSRSARRGSPRCAPRARPVFVYFTADWCLTCKVNENAARWRAARSRAAFRARGVAVLIGDWTRGDPAIGRFLESQGRSGVPLYLWYAPGRRGAGAAADPDGGDADGLGRLVLPWTGRGTMRSMVEGAPSMLA